jgi:hypothetical protein
MEVDLGILTLLEKERRNREKYMSIQGKNGKNTIKTGRKSDS